MSAVLIAAASALILQSTPPRPTVPGYHQPGTPHAYFTLQATDMLRPDWPEGYGQYTLFVCAASFASWDVARSHVGGDLRLSRPNSLAYTNAQDVDVAGTFTGIPYWTALEAKFDTTFCIRDLSTGKCIRMDTPRTHPAWIPMQASVDSLVAFHAQYTLVSQGGSEWDGFYIDNCMATYPAWRKALLPASFDCDGDGLPNTVQELDAQWAAWRPYLSARLREVAGDTRIIVGNAGGALLDGCLNGITIEGVGHTHTEANAKTYFEAQKAISQTPFVGVAWVTQESTDAYPSARVVGQVPGVYLGVVEP